MVLPPWISNRKDGALLLLHVQPGASRSEVAGEHGTRLKMRIAAPAVDNAANETLLEFLRERLGVPSRQIGLVRGATSRAKDVLVEGVAPETLVGMLLSPQK